MCADRGGADRGGADRYGADGGGIVLGWLTKLAVTLSLLAVVSFDLLSVGTTVLRLSDQGTAAARQASAAWHATPTVQSAYDTAVRTALRLHPENAVDPATFRVDADGTVHLSVQREARTVLAHRIGPLRRWLTVTRTESARVPSS